jgi:hypothetical protein
MYTTKLSTVRKASKFEQVDAKGHRTYAAILDDGTILRFFIHGKPGAWKSTELTTGRGMTRGHTIIETIQDTQKMVNGADPVALRLTLDRLDKTPTDGFYIAIV